MATRLPDFRSEADMTPARMRDMVRAIEQRFASIEGPIGVNYVIEGTPSGLKILNVDTATDAEIRQFLGSLINDLLARNLLRR